jgi:FtsP/CotA-like multicopper oxidase with cupredoxin domain
MAPSSNSSQSFAFANPRSFFLAAAIGLLLGGPLAAQTPAPAPAPAPTPTPTATSPAFQNPSEVSSHDGKLQAVMMLGDAMRVVPGGVVGNVRLRFFQGWPFQGGATPKAGGKSPAQVDTYSPGPTLRARVGEKVEIMFLNTVDDSHFPYSFVTGEGKTNDPSYGCDQASNRAIYPANDRFPNCFHGSSTANLHFHGTHANPDGLGDDVLVQVLPDKTTTEQQWAATFKTIFDSPVIPAKWNELPQDYRTAQEKAVRAQGGDLWTIDQQQIASGQWPQYLVGAFPNVFEIPDLPKQSDKYQAGQAPGTHWYHAHKHGSTSLHNLNGLAGAFVIEGPYDDFIRDFYHLGKTYGESFEKVLVFQMINPNQNLERTNVNFGNGVLTGALLVNGQSLPTITMKPNEIQLWRIVNATPGSVFKGTKGSTGPGVIGPDLFQTAGFTFVQTAMDGVQFSTTNYKNQPFLVTNPFTGKPNTNPVPNQAGAVPGLQLASGNRVDVLVRAPANATTTPVSYSFTSNGAAVFSVSVSAGSGSPMVFPCEKDPTSPTCWATMPAFLKDLNAPADRPHQVTFGWDAEPGRNAAGGARLTSKVGINLPPKFTIDNHQFEEFGPIVDQCVPLNALQDWIVENKTTVSHPFHIHVNPFQVVKIEVPAVNASGTGFTYTTYTPENNFVWQDVVMLPAGAVLADGQLAPGKVTIRQHFVDFTGTFVLHCHILAHEDRGMMQLVRVVPADKFPAACQAAIPQHH